jgi:hypothetical protein
MASCPRLQRAITELNISSNIPIQIYSGHKRYHYSLIHKLKSAKKHLENLQSVLENTQVSSVVDNSTDFINEVNMHIDSFFYCCGSAMDILSREVIVYFDIVMPSKVFFHTAFQQVSANRPGDPLLARLSDPTWLKEFKDYRNALTHEVLIGTNFSIAVNADGGKSQTLIVYPLPDNPRADIEERTFRNNPNAFEYCKNTFTRLLTLINTIYGDIYQRVRSNGTLPL